MNEGLVAGIDAGATKTRACVVGRAGEVVGRSAPRRPAGMGRVVTGRFEARRS